jgi:CheY-like chemotaxis protein
MVRETVDMLQTQAEARHLKLALEAEQELPEITTDDEKLKQVLINLIGNAIKFTHEGVITVRIYGEDTDNTHSAVLIDVSDTGIGIPDHMLATVFEPFRQVDSGTTRKYGGTGLGLTITRSIVEMLGGSISVRSQVDQGSTFTVSLPVMAGMQTAERHFDISGQRELAAGEVLHTAVREERAPDNIAVADKRLVLVIDDDADARELLSGYIEEIGAAAIAAADGEQALELARIYQPSLITLDLMMPGVDGWEVLRRLKADSELKHIPVVIISIVAERRQALILGAIDALTKPITQGELIAILQRSLHTSRQGRLLVIDDNEEVLELYKTLLENEVAEVRTAANGKEALIVLQDYKPDLIFLDLMMPEMDGLTFLRILRTEKQLMSMPVVIVTAKQLSEAEHRELEMRVVQIIQKGEVNLEAQLRLTLEQVLSNQQKYHAQ